MKHSLTLREGRRTRETVVDAGESLLAAMRRLDGQEIEAPCGGRGLCGKCRVRLVEGALSPPEAAERVLLSSAELAEGFRLACLARIAGDLCVERAQYGEAAIVESGRRLGLVIDPPVRSLVVRLAPGSLEDQGEDESRLLAALAALLPAELAPQWVELPALRVLANAARDGQALRATVAAGRVIGLRKAREGERDLAAGIDLGTTTIVCHLVELATGEVLARSSQLNSQRSFGADVISRISAAAEIPGGLEELRGRVASQISTMVALAARAAGAQADEVSCIAVAGNTTMMHLLAGVSPDAISRSPFIPAFLKTRTESAMALGLADHPLCAAILLPGLSAYVGADIAAGMAAIGLAELSGRSLFIDLGTNGEIAFGGRDGILACATAAGPAFEGAGIEKGSGGVGGAIEAVWMEEDGLRYGTIGGVPASGICGSGLIDAIAVFLDCGLVEDSGRIVDAGEASALGPKIAALRGENERGPLLHLDRDRGIYLSQADIRAAQLAKAAIAAGITTLIACADTMLASASGPAAGAGLGGPASGEAAGAANVDRLFLAGGFGSLLDVRSAVRIGLLPPSLADRVIVAGNSSGAGAVAACLSRTMVAACARACEFSTYVELSSRADFNGAYVDAMMFPERQ